jgi:hypothetical protein
MLTLTISDDGCIYYLEEDGEIIAQSNICPTEKAKAALRRIVKWEKALEDIIKSDGKKRFDDVLIAAQALGKDAKDVKVVKD